MPPLSMKNVDVIAAVLLVPVCAWVFYESRTWPILPDMGDPGWIPRGVAVCLLVAASLLLLRALQGRSLTLPSRLQGADRTRVLWVAALTGVYVIVVERLGFIMATAPYMLGFGLALGERRWARLAVFAIVVPAAMYFLFDVTLNVPLPRGIFR